MSELNIFLSALQSAFATSVQQAVAAATAPLVERIDALEKNEEYLTRRITALENNPAIGVDTTLERRVAVLEGSHQMSADAFVTHLDNQEWFWEKLTRKAGEVAEAAVEEAMDEHTSTYDHDDYDNHLGDDDKHFDGDIEDAVRDALNGTSVTLSF